MEIESLLRRGRDGKKVDPLRDKDAACSPPRRYRGRIGPTEQAATKADARGF